jgi:hypothetical protein
MYIIGAGGPGVGQDLSKFHLSVLLFFQNFREQGIDGSTLLLLKEDHLVTTMKMRLGSVLKFKAALAKKIGSCPICLHCVHCHNEASNITSSTTSKSQNADNSALPAPAPPPETEINETKSEPAIEDN